MARKNSGSEFHVVLEGLKLKADVEERISLRIRQIVLEELAGLDLTTELRVAPNGKFPGTFGYPGGTRGLWAASQALAE